MRKLCCTTAALFCSCYILDIDECAGDPCENEGTCVDGVNEYVCQCKLGYNGTNCTTGKS